MRISKPSWSLSVMALSIGSRQRQNLHKLGDIEERKLKDGFHAAGTEG